MYNFEIELLQQCSNACITSPYRNTKSTLYRVYTAYCSRKYNFCNVIAVNHQMKEILYIDSCSFN